MTKSCENCWHYDMPDDYCQRWFKPLNYKHDPCEEHSEMTEEEVEERDYGFSK